MDLNRQEERILKAIEGLGPDCVYNRMFQRSKERAALARLIRGGLIKADFSARDEEPGQAGDAQVIRPDRFDLHFSLTAKGRLYADDIYLPNCLFSGRLMLISAVICLLIMVGFSLWLL